jgi:hypothetical protein
MKRGDSTRRLIKDRNGAGGIRTADLPGAEEGAQTREESPLPRIKEKKVVDDGRIVGTSAKLASG